MICRIKTRSGAHKQIVQLSCYYNSVNGKGMNFLCISVLLPGPNDYLIKKPQTAAITYPMDMGNSPGPAQKYVEKHVLLVC